MEKIIISALAIGVCGFLWICWLIFLNVLYWSSKPKQKTTWKPKKAREFNTKDFK